MFFFMLAFAATRGFPDRKLNIVASVPRTVQEAESEKNSQKLLICAAVQPPKLIVIRHAYKTSARSEIPARQHRFSLYLPRTLHGDEAVARKVKGLFVVLGAVMSRAGRSILYSCMISIFYTIAKNGEKMNHGAAYAWHMTAVKPLAAFLPFYNRIMRRKLEEVASAK